ncbi:MAG: TRAP transporter small permease [Tateyamaria sp.]|jgi:TRAP-type C4-dicarboxylate transport system permease small subunit|nr:TRAP transporter small permease [Tateyamaria sp.]MBT5301471.1 TRAP transporter small permease [Tateyamaria sp.]MBT6267832.1 TRAP transporter small permease [Tateyamaria sp.]MBT6344303.1 TRAP transporter small permease [Tateyamaria sp.]MBT7448347.1 TRAP transporter small permease [Tateyamaria sp.]
MSVASAVLEDSSLLSRLDRSLLPIERFMALLSGIAAFSLMFLAAYSVTGRELFEKPLLGYVDLIEILMPLIAIMGVSYVQRQGSHIRMDIIIGATRGRVLWFLELFTVVLILILMIALVWGSWAHFDRSFDCARPLCSRDSSIDISLPIWPSKFIVPMAFAVLCARLVLQATGYSRAFWLNLERPVAVPLIQSIAAQARAEAEVLDNFK